MGNCLTINKNTKPPELTSILSTEIKTINAIKDDEKFLLLSQLSHDLNTPLTSIMLGVDLLTDVNISNEDKLVIIDNMKTAYEFILMLSRKTVFYFNDGKVTPIYKSVDIRSLLERCIKIMSQTTFLPINLIIADNVPLYTQCDESWLWDIVINLLSNAKKFTVTGYIEININFSENYIIYTIIDTGVGITSDRVKLLFKPFQTTNKSFGTGIGLYGCKIRTENLNGTIKYFPNQEGGSNFVVSIPHIACTNFSKEKDLVSTNDINITMYKHLNILLIDDDIVLLKLLKKILLKYTENIITCNNITEAKKLVNNNIFQCIITDKQINNENGIEFIKYLEDINYNCYKCILSGSILTKELNNQFKNYIDYYEKPISKNTIELMLLKTINYYNLNKVLIVDDEHIICKIMLKMCDNFGLQALCKYNGQEALDEIGPINEKKYSIIFLDLSMPVLDGFEFIKRLKLSKKQTPYIVVITAHSSREEIIKDNNNIINNVNEIIKKPLRLTDVINIIDRATEYNLSK
jgi:CheY-like chemotaxis protein